MDGSSFNIPQFVRASSPRGLVRVMLSNNLRLGAQFSYQILRDGNGWIAWYTHKLDRTEQLSKTLEEVNGISKKI